MSDKELILAARRARESAYAPYSHFKVGAALLSKDGTVFLGCNIENASYGATLCAERSAFSAALVGGVHDFDAIAIAGGSEGEKTVACTPCGICRQVMAEFCSSDFKIILEDDDGRIKTVTLGELLPSSFHLSK